VRKGIAPSIPRFRLEGNALSFPRSGLEGNALSFPGVGSEVEQKPTKGRENETVLLVKVSTANHAKHTKARIVSRGPGISRFNLLASTKRCAPGWGKTLCRFHGPGWREMLCHFPVSGQRFEQKQTKTTKRRRFSCRPGSSFQPSFPWFAVELPTRASTKRCPPGWRETLCRFPVLPPAVNNFPKIVVASSGGGGRMFGASKVKWGPDWTMGMNCAILRHHQPSATGASHAPD